MPAYKTRVTTKQYAYRRFAPSLALAFTRMDPPRVKYTGLLSKLKLGFQHTPVYATYAEIAKIVADRHTKPAYIVI